MVEQEVMCSGCGAMLDVLNAYLIFFPGDANSRKQKNGMLTRHLMYCCEDCFQPPPVDLAKVEREQADVQ